MVSAHFHCEQQVFFHLRYAQRFAVRGVGSAPRFALVDIEDVLIFRPQHAVGVVLRVHTGHFVGVGAIGAGIRIALAVHHVHIPRPVLVHIRRFHHVHFQTVSARAYQIAGGHARSIAVRHHPERRPYAHRRRGDAAHLVVAVLAGKTDVVVAMRDRVSHGIGNRAVHPRGIPTGSVNAVFFILRAYGQGAVLDEHGIGSVHIVACPAHAALIAHAPFGVIYLVSFKLIAPHQLVSALFQHVVQRDFIGQSLCPGTAGENARRAYRDRQNRDNKQKCYLFHLFTPVTRTGPR